MSAKVKATYNRLENLKFLSHLIARSFLMAILFLMIILCVLMTVYFADLFLNAKKGNLKNPLFNAYVIVSPSMVPTIKINDAIVVRRVDNDAYKIGDIITFLSSSENSKGLTVTHRIVDKNNLSKNHSLYTTRGDNNLVNDSSAVKTDSIYGRVVLKIPKMGYIQNYLSKPINFFICILIPSLIVIVYDMVRIISVLIKRRRES